jgi:hypothetical protein
VSQNPTQTQTLGSGTTTSAEGFWYILQCIYLGMGYFAKVPIKKALSEYGLVELTGAEKFWYTLMCILFGAGYFSKCISKKALSEVRFAPQGYAAPPAAGQAPYGG